MDWIEEYALWVEAAEEWFSSAEAETPHYAHMFSAVSRRAMRRKLGRDDEQEIFELLMV